MRPQQKHVDAPQADQQPTNSRPTADQPRPTLQTVGAECVHNREDAPQADQRDQQQTNSRPTRPIPAARTRLNLKPGTQRPKPATTARPTTKPCQSLWDMNGGVLHLALVIAVLAVRLLTCCGGILLSAQRCLAAASLSHMCLSWNCLFRYRCSRRRCCYLGCWCRCFSPLAVRASNWPCSYDSCCLLVTPGAKLSAPRLACRGQGLPPAGW